MPRITVDEWVAELRRVSAPPEGLSLREWQEKLGTSYTTTRTVLIQAQKRGLLQLAGYRAGISLDGKAHKLPVYSLLVEGELSGVAFNQLG
jgi:transposase